jgi:Abnormal spindle-like microcephaly-assoc'd, ASPM-SPD-2-Hydin
MVSDGTLIYTNSGQVWDPKAKTLLGRYDSNLFYEPGIVADATAKRTFILEGQYQPDNGYAYPAVVSYDPATFKLAGAIYFNLPTSPTSLARWGSDGFAFLTGATYGDFKNPTSESKLVLFRSSLATPGTATIATVTSLSPASVIAGSPALTLMVNGSGFGAGSTVLWNGVVRATTFVSTSQVTAAISAADLAATGTAQVSVSSNGTVSPNVPFKVDGPVVALSAKTLTFAPQPVATASAAQTVTVRNSGTTPLTGLSIGLKGAGADSFVANSACGSSLAASDSCAVSVVFNPASAGGKQATLQITDSAADSPQTVTLNGTAAVPSFVLSSQLLSFGQLPVGTSAQQVLTLQNSSTVPLANISAAVNGQNAADFTAASNCGSSLAAGGSCTLSVRFMPSVAGDKSATLTLAGSGVTAQSVALSGTSTLPDFVLPAPTGSATATVPAGQPANFNLNVSQYGAFTGTVTMSCTNLPAYASCTFTPASFIVGSTPTVVTLNISTQQPVQASLRPGSEVPGWPTALAALLALPAASRHVRRRLRKAHLLLWLVVIFAGTFVLNGCSGGSGSTNNPNPPAAIQKTSPGTYTVTVVATSGTVSHGTNVTLVVQ